MGPDNQYDTLYQLKLAHHTQRELERKQLDRRVVLYVACILAGILMLVGYLWWIVSAPPRPLLDAIGSPIVILTGRPQ